MTEFLEGFRRFINNDITCYKFFGWRWVGELRWLKRLMIKKNHG